MEPAIIIDSVYKDFVLPHSRANTLKSSFLRLFTKSLYQNEVQHALSGISLEIKKGEFFGIAGRNGSGKSTLLKMLAGIYQPTKGSITVNGKLVPFIELGVGFNPELTGRENVYLNGAILGFSEAQVDAMYDDIVEFSELERFMDQKLKNYSSGMQVRLAFSVAIRANSDILLIDEVLAVGDAAFKRKCFNFFMQLKKEKRTVVFVSHDMDAIRQFCDRAALIDMNKLVTVGSAQKITDAYSKMFMEEAVNRTNKGHVGGPDKGGKRWGTGGVRIDKVTVRPSILTDDTKFIEFGGDLTVAQDTEKPVIGFKIADAGGNLITGTNSSLLRVTTGRLSAGSKVTFLWRVPNIFSNGHYEISLAVKEQNDEALDVWDSATSFEVVKSLSTTYIVTPPMHLTLSREKRT